jgi:hypothetical protein
LNAKSASTTAFTEGDHVSFLTTSNYPWPVTGTITGVYEMDGERVANVLTDGQPGQGAGITFIVELADLKRIRSAR